MKGLVLKIVAGIILLGGLAWISLPTAPTAQSTETVSPRSETAGTRPPSGARPNSPFLASHERQSAAGPGADDVAPSFHVGLEQLRKQVAENPSDAPAILELARLLQDGHQTKESIVEYRRYLKLVPGGREAWLDLAKTFGEEGDWTNALAVSDSMLTHFPNDPSGLYNKGAALANMGKLAEAKEAWLLVQTQDEDPQMKQMAELAIARLGR